MLNEFQRSRLWENYVSARTRALYFADLASAYTRQLQWQNGANLFLASGAAATIVAGHPHWAEGLAAGSAALLAASFAIGFEKRIATMTRLHVEWSQIAAGYERLWSHLDDPAAEQRFEELVERERAPSELGTTAPYDRKRLEKWMDLVIASLYGPTAQHG